MRAFHMLKLSIVTLIFKCFGKRMNHQQKHEVGEIFLHFIRYQGLTNYMDMNNIKLHVIVLTGEFNFDDGRSAVDRVTKFS